MSVRKVVASDGTTLLLVKADPSCRAYVISTWVRSYWTKRPGIKASIFHEYEPRMVERMFDSGMCWVLKVDKDDNTVHGWICGKPGLLHWAHIPPELRGNGLFRAMVASVCQSKRPQCSRVQDKFPWNPYRVAEVA